MLLVDSLAGVRAQGSRPRAGLLRSHRRRPVAAGLQAASARPRPPAGRRLGGPGAAGAPLHRGVRPPRPGHRPGAADRRRRDPAQPLPQRPAHLRQAARARRGPDRQRERHGRHLRDPLRRQRPARRAGGPPRARRPAGAALRRRRAVRRTAQRRDEPAHPRGHQRRRSSRASTSAVPRRGPRHRRHADQARGGPDRDRRRHPGGADQHGARAARRWRAPTPAPCSTRPAGAARPGCSGWRTPPSPRAGSSSTPGAVRAVTERRASLLPAGITGVAGTFVGRRPGRPRRRGRRRGRPRAGQLRLRRSCPGCSVGPPASWRASWARRTSARSCTATISSLF